MGELVGVTLTINKSHSSDLVILLVRLERVDLFLGVKGSVWGSGQVVLCNSPLTNHTVVISSFC